MIGIRALAEIVNINRKRDRPLAVSQFRASGKLRVTTVNDDAGDLFPWRTQLNSRRRIAVGEEVRHFPARRLDVKIERGLSAAGRDRARAIHLCAGGSAAWSRGRGCSCGWCSCGR